MGYTLVIGEAEINFDNDDGLESSCSLTARSERHDNAPAFGEPTDFTNERWPSYSAWSNFCAETGLEDVFYHNGGGHLRGGHPGCIPVEIEMQKRVRSALEAYKAAHPKAEATYERESKIEGHLCRLVWLDYWVSWALENCERPVFANS